MPVSTHSVQSDDDLAFLAFSVLYRWVSFDVDVKRDAIKLLYQVVTNVERSFVSNPKPDVQVVNDSRWNVAFEQLLMVLIFISTLV